MKYLNFLNFILMNIWKFILWCLVNIGNFYSYDFYDIEIDEHDTLNSIKRYNPNGEYEWHKRIPYGFKDNEELVFKTLMVMISINILLLLFGIKFNMGPILAAIFVLMYINYKK